jgi:hypothetical protein
MGDARCAACGGELIGPLALDTVAGGDSGELHVKVMPTSGVFRSPTRSQVGAMACVDCGRLELRADITEIAERWREGQR